MKADAAVGLLLLFDDHYPNVGENLLFSMQASASSRSNPRIVKTNLLSNNLSHSNKLISPGRVIRMAAALGILLAALALSSSRAATVTTNGFDLFVNGSRMVIKGINYSPCADRRHAGQSSLRRLLSSRNTAMSGLPTFKTCARLALMRSNFTQAIRGSMPAQPGSAGNWKQFLDACYNGGSNPIYVVMFSYVQGDVIAAGGAAYQQYITDYQNLVGSTATHPAILGYCVGNEIFGGDVTSNPQFWVNYGALLNAAKAAGQSAGSHTISHDRHQRRLYTGRCLAGHQAGRSVRSAEQPRCMGNQCLSWTSFGGLGNSVFVQYQQLMTSLNKTKPLILGEWGTPHSTRQAPGVYGNDGSGGPPTNLDNVPQNQMGPGQPYFAATTTSQFLTTQWQTISANVGAGTNQVCVGGFIFDWCDEYWKGGNPNAQQGGPNQGFQGGAFAGGYWDEAWFGITSAVDQSQYGNNQPNINRTLFDAYAGIQAFYTLTTHLASSTLRPSGIRRAESGAAGHRHRMADAEVNYHERRDRGDPWNGVRRRRHRSDPCPRSARELSTRDGHDRLEQSGRPSPSEAIASPLRRSAPPETPPPKTLTIYRIPDHRRGKNDWRGKSHWRRDR